VLWHSSAHVLGECLEQLYGVDLTIGPTIEEGFYYDCYMGDGRGTLTHEDWPRITSKMEACVKEAQLFQRVEISKEEALEMFQENRFKVCFSVVSLRSGASRGCRWCPEECTVAQEHPRRIGTPIRRRMRCLTASRDRAQRPNLEPFTNASTHDRIVMRRIQLSFCILSRAKWLRMHLFALQPGPCAAGAKSCQHAVLNALKL
jgi:hypothetical protein